MLYHNVMTPKVRASVTAGREKMIASRRKETTQIPIIATEADCRLRCDDVVFLVAVTTPTMNVVRSSKCGPQPTQTFMHNYLGVCFRKKVGQIPIGAA